MSPAYSRYCGTVRGPNISFFMTSENPMIALSGVRSSWLIMARKSVLVRFAVSAASFASCNASLASRRSVTSRNIPSQMMEPSGCRRGCAMVCTQTGASPFETTRISISTGVRVWPEDRSKPLSALRSSG